MGLVYMSSGTNHIGSQLQRLTRQFHHWSRLTRQFHRWRQFHAAAAIATEDVDEAAAGIAVVREAAAAATKDDAPAAATTDDTDNAATGIAVVAGEAAAAAAAAAAATINDIDNAAAGIAAAANTDTAAMMKSFLHVTPARAPAATRAASWPA